ncbi:MAG TPA: SDR family oxidoreductase [Terriglobales bacterium]|nr:SDR family oxidoreductase [Terriglobales bacterium]
MRALARGGMAVAGLTAAGAVAGAAALAWGVNEWQRQRSFDLSGKTALVTGGSRGLGFAIARELLRRGCRVAICARDSDALHRAASKLESEAPAGAGVFAYACDLTQPAAAGELVAAVRAHWGRMQVLVHNAGIIQLGPWDAMTESDFQRAMDIHFWAALRLAQAALPDMIRHQQGRIVNISSIGGLVAVPHMLPYTCSKFALVGLSQGLASEVRRHGVRVCCVCPFLTRTGSQEQVTVKGRHDREFAWFAASGSLPGLNQSADHVARVVVRVCERGTAQTTLSLPGKAAAMAHGLAPSAVVGLMAQADRLLPSSQAPEAHEPRYGRDSYNPWTRRVVQPFIRQEGSRLNQA